MISYIAGAIVGAAYGSLVGYVKYTALWKRIIKSNKQITTGVLYQHMAISYAINVATLLFVFLMRDMIPWSFPVVIAAAAVMLSLIGKLSPVSEIVDHVEEKAGESI